MVNKVLLAVAGLSLVAGLGQEAQAALDYHCRYVSEQPTYNVSPGGTVTVNLYLQETSDVPPASLLAGNGGLLQGAVSVSLSSGTATVSDPVVAGAFDLLQLFVSTASTADLWGISSAGSPVANLGGGVSQVLIGTITIHAGGPGDSSDFIVTPHTSGGASVTYSPQTYNLDDLNDPSNPGDAATLYAAAGSSIFTVITAVPEPLSLSAASMCCLLMLHRRQRAKTQTSLGCRTA